ncbi:MAG: divergent polysaccharide deacetylase family protein [Rhodobacteraceae bacterium]|nr:divergent polysaccharide deacetylase family protein [Paracoccaceae bacterium]
MRGFLGGVSIGAVIAVIGAVAISVISPLPQKPEVEATAPQNGTAPDVTGEPGELVTATDPDLVESAPVTPGTSQDAGTTQAALDAETTSPGEKPRVGVGTDNLQTPEPTTGAAEVTASQDDPVTETQPAAAPAVPSGDSSVSLATQPAQPTAPEMSTTNSGFGTDLATSSDAPEAPEAETAAPANLTEPAAPAEDTGETPPETNSAITESAEPPAPAPRIAALPQAGDATEDTGPTIGTPGISIIDRNQPAAQVAEAPADEAPSVPPFEAYAAAFENPDDKPLMSIVLIDDADAIGAEALLDFPYPLSFAVDPGLPDAADRMARHRAAGFEVLVLADLPAQATPVDAEAAFESWINVLPETIGVMEGSGSGIQGNRPLSDQVTALIKDSGRGLLTQDRGLNTVRKLAARDGVPSGVVFRDFDGAGQTPKVMRRFLDQAAFRSGQMGAVIMVGRVRPGTISALLLWGLQDRASRVALAPVSASLNTEVK